MIDNDDNIFFQKFGQKITELRKAQKLTKVQLAFEINTSESNIRRIENGKTNIGLATLRKLSVALDVPISYFFEEM